MELSACAGLIIISHEKTTLQESSFRNKLAQEEQGLVIIPGGSYVLYDAFSGCFSTYITRWFCDIIHCIIINSLNHKIFKNSKFFSDNNKYCWLWESGCEIIKSKISFDNRFRDCLYIILKIGLFIHNLCVLATLL